MITEPLAAAGASGSFSRAPTGRFRPIETVVPGRPTTVPRLDPSRLPAAALSRQRRAPPPIEDDTDLVGYLLLVLLFLAIVW